MGQGYVRAGIVGLALADLGIIDAHSFYYLETWALSSAEPYTTEYLTDVYYFQRQATTWAFKFASGAAEAPSSSSSRTGRRPIPNAFVTKISKAFLDATYAFLDGLVLLATEGSPVTDAENSHAMIASVDAGRRHPIDTSEMVSFFFSIRSQIPHTQGGGGGELGHTHAPCDLQLCAPETRAHSKHGQPTRERV